ncbi:MAG: NAD-dependent epimerase/dehydratase [Verrucomicrobia bacterium]|nr:MAG: NAD-dependent epimerase/dehydratase [Verrucomicrobiota bacterium]
MNYLVLGSAGQIGSHLCDFLRHQDASVIEFDLVKAPEQDLRHHSRLLLEKVSGADFVMFLAFDVGGARYLKTYQHTYDFLSNNTKLMDNVFDALKVFRKPFIFASSQMSNMSYSSYGVLKALGEYYTRALNGLIVRLWNVYGVEHDGEKSHAITDFILKAKTLGRIEMMTDGQEMRQFLYADDCSEALWLLSKPEFYASLSREANLHVTSFEWTRILDVAELVGKLMAVPVVPAGAGDVIQKDLRNEPDDYILRFWQPRTSLEEGVSRIIKETR